MADGEDSTTSAISGSQSCLYRRMERRGAAGGEEERRKERWRRAALTRSREMRILSGVSEVDDPLGRDRLSELVSELRKDISDSGWEEEGGE